ncbi:coxsackievirus and adenovirus receptor homolog [Protopterus annectens]|uniref:coxsackievirus and adenovirus receptor homolog n=1 Tax=Protopterus annectens TaxID=7888 RepID=UPI001CFA26AF|nr:coxsackievirus and adenovirus receptor homolog [Protopterus annectens]
MVWTLGYKCGMIGMIACAFQFTLLLLNFGSLLAVTITSVGDPTLQVATGDSVQLNCTYTLASTDAGSLDIEWSIIRPDSRDKDIVVLAFMENQVYQYLPPSLAGRFKFVVLEPSGGDASVVLSNIQESDTGIYQCKVKKTPGIDSRKITLAIFARPTKPTCRIEETQDGKGVILKCKADGTTPITYTWEAAGDQSTALPASAVQGESCTW